MRRLGLLLAWAGWAVTLAAQAPVPVTFGWAVPVTDTATSAEVERNGAVLPCGPVTGSPAERRCTMSLPPGVYTFRLRGVTVGQPGPWSDPLVATIGAGTAPGMFTLRWHQFNEADMAITRVQYASKGIGFTDGELFLEAPSFGASTTAGNLIVVCTRSADATGESVQSVSDTLGNTYTRHVTLNEGADAALTIWSAVSSSSGTNAVRGTWNDTNFFRWVFAVEYAPGSGRAWSTTAATRLDASNTGTDTSGPTLTAGAISTSQAETVVVACGTQNDAADYTAGTDFTMIDGTIDAPDVPLNMGGVEEYITSGTLSSYVTTMTSSNGPPDYWIAVAAFKTSASAGSRKIIFGPK